MITSTTKIKIKNLDGIEPLPGKPQESSVCREEERLLTNLPDEGGLRQWAKELEAHITQYGGEANYPTGKCFGTPPGRTSQNRDCGGVSEPLCCGDMNEDGGFNVLDIVTLANAVLSGECSNYEFGTMPCCIGDVNGDGGLNVLDIVTLANCVLSPSSNCDNCYCDDFEWTISPSCGMWENDARMSSCGCGDCPYWQQLQQRTTDTGDTVYRCFDANPPCCLEYNDGWGGNGDDSWGNHPEIWNTSRTDPCWGGNGCSGSDTGKIWLGPFGGFIDCDGRCYNNAEENTSCPYDGWYEIPDGMNCEDDAWNCPGVYTWGCERWYNDNFCDGGPGVYTAEEWHSPLNFNCAAYNYDDGICDMCGISSDFGTCNYWWQTTAGNPTGCIYETGCNNWCPDLPGVHNPGPGDVALYDDLCGVCGGDNSTCCPLNENFSDWLTGNCIFFDSECEDDCKAFCPWGAACTYNWGCDDYDDSFGGVDMKCRCWCGPG